MESFFPQLFFLSFVAVIIPRLAVAGVMLYDAHKIWKLHPKKRIFSGATALLGLLIAVGLFTQLAAVAAIVQIGMAALRYKNESVFGNRIVATLSIAILLFLVVVGPGGIAFDLPY